MNPKLKFPSESKFSPTFELSPISNYFDKKLFKVETAKKSDPMVIGRMVLRWENLDDDSCAINNNPSRLLISIFWDD